MDFYPEFQEIFAKNKITEFTPIQKAVEGPLRDGESIVGLAKTGTGKTFAYSLPLLKLVEEKAANSLVIFEPTTELAVQVRDAIAPFAKKLGLTIAALVGSGNRVRQIEVLKKKHPEVIIVTPGRFFDLVTENRIRPEQIKHLVIDEADDILEAMKLELLASLGQSLGAKSQIALFGATESAITKDAEKIFQRNFLKIDVRDADVNRVQHLFLQVDNRHKMDVFTQLTKLDDFSAMVFFNSVKQLEYFSGVLSHTKISFSALSNATNKQASRSALQKLTGRKIKALLTTDLSARGIDINDLMFVVNYELPSDRNTYLHRAGRTGRMGKAGTVISLGTDHDFRNLKKIVGSEVEIVRGYFSGFTLTTNKPLNEVKKNSGAITEKNLTGNTHEAEAQWSQTTEEKVESKKASLETTTRTKKQQLARQKRKKKEKNQKNKGYHPLSEKKAKKAQRETKEKTN